MKYLIMNGDACIFGFETRELAEAELEALRAAPDGVRRNAGMRCTIAEVEHYPPFAPIGGLRADGSPQPFELDPATGYARPSEYFAKHYIIAY